MHVARYVFPAKTDIADPGIEQAGNIIYGHFKAADIGGSVCRGQLPKPLDNSSPTCAEKPSLDLWVNLGQTPASRLHSSRDVAGCGDK